MGHAVHHGPHGLGVDIEDDFVRQPVEAVLVEAGAGVEPERLLDEVWGFGRVVAGRLRLGGVDDEVREAARRRKVAREEFDVDLAGIAVVLSLLVGSDKGFSYPEEGRASAVHMGPAGDFEPDPEASISNVIPDHH